MKKGDLLRILLNKYNTDTLAGVYLAKYKNQNDAKIWIEEFKKSLTNADDHPDILVVKRDIVDGSKTKEYKVDSKEIQQFLNSVAYKPVSLKKKIIFITDAHLLSDIVSNKLLKTFEEIPSHVSIFLLAPNEENLLQTVESRALKIHIPIFEDKINTDLSTSSISEILTLYSKQKDEEDILTQYVDCLINKKINNQSYAELSELLDSLKHFNTSEKFNNSLATRLALLKNI